MFGSQFRKTLQKSVFSTQPITASVVEVLEDRRLLSAAVVHADVHAHVSHHVAKHVATKHHVKASKTATTSSSSATSTSSASSTSSTGTASTTDDNGPGTVTDSLPFSEVPSTIQKGLITLAVADSLSAPTSTQTVYLGNSNGVETYTLDYTSSGTTTKITVDVNGNAVTAPTLSTTTWATLDGTGSGSDAAAAAEILAIATADSLAAPTSTTTINVSTPSSGAAVYTLTLAASSTSTTNSGYDGGNTRISVDASGNPVANQTVPFSAVPTAVQTAINANLPTGATALATTSTQSVQVTTQNGVIFYSTTFTTSGTSTTVTVNAAGELASLPSTTTTAFSAIPAAAQNELQTLATADGLTGTIAASQVVTAYSEGNGTTVYTATITGTNSSNASLTVTVSSDENGNPTVPPRDGRFGGGCDGGGGYQFDNGGDFGGLASGLSSFGGWGR